MKKTVFIIPVLLIFLAGSVFLFFRNDPDPGLRWICANVSSRLQGDAHLISHEKKHILIDGGYAGEAIDNLLPLMKKLDIHSLDSVIITHPHMDHYEGLRVILERRTARIGKVYMNFPTDAQCKAESPWGCRLNHLSQIKDLLAKAGVPVIRLFQGQRIKVSSSAEFEVLYAYDGINTPAGKTDINDMSVILSLSHGSHRFLFTGDLNKKIGNYLSKHGKGLKANILKVPHHGTESLPGNDFFEHINPDILIIPSPAKLWCSRRSSRIRTLARDPKYTSYINGFHGHISVFSDGKKISVKTEHTPVTLCEN